MSLDRLAICAGSALLVLGLAACATPAVQPTASTPPATDPATATAASGAARAAAFDIPYTKHILGNGLTLLVHEDHKAPIVAVNVWYHVGSKDEPEGLHGFAHLFEHLMFNGSEHYNDEFFRPLEAVGASKMNGTTWFDRTNYFENVPTSALDMTLWMESDRMGHLTGAIDQSRLDEQRGVVLNEKRQGENQPYGQADDLIAKETYPAGHPYSWTTIGSEKDLNAAKVADVKKWFDEHYGAANATLVIAGDVDTAEVIKKVELYFGDIAPGPTLDRHGPWTAKMSGPKRSSLQDRVPQARLFQVWNVPGFCDHDTNLLQLAGEVLAGSKNSRLYQRLVYQDRSATSVNAGLGPFEIGSQFQIDTLLAPGADIKAVEAAIEEELQRFLRDGPTAEELERVKVQHEGDFVRGLERIDGFTGKSSILAEYQVYCGTPDYYKTEMSWILGTTPQEVRDVTRSWLSDGRFTLDVQPFPEYSAAKTGADRSKLPAVGAAPALKLPPLQRATLSNGLQVLLAERHEVPVIQATLLVDAGYSADAGIAPGTAKMMLDMLDEGTPTMDSLAIARRAEDLGAVLISNANSDAALIGVNALKTQLAPSLDLFADVLLHPSFPDKELSRLKQQRLAAIQQEKTQPTGIMTRLYPQLIYGTGHAYSNPRSGNGNEASVAGLSADDLKRFYARWLRPDNAQLLIVGDTTLAEIKPMLEARLAGWRAPAEARPSKNLASVALPERPRVFLVNKTGAGQTLIAAVLLAPPKSDADDVAVTVANNTLGGLFISRLNMNLREDKRWSYGASSQLGNARGQRPFLAYAPVQADKTVESMREMDKELRAIVGRKPITAQELKLSADNIVVGLPGDNETAGEVAGSYLNILQFGLPDTYYDELVPRVENLSVADANAALKRYLKPDAMTWVVIGDLSKIEAPVRKLGFGDVQVLDADGKLLR
ncbi:MAG: insulinase family protein [Hydrocarboniphaga sp.]|uniref:M16 family metallopeptidase n=1 Tax=Hydrocarboniphaga sp. TaxID=2033016 RepID=UPI0026053A4F|nr:pitrilysin family protein [Hydrocarboniphaga sp.]MDB5972059.1 insulinase family protein [Hydrocarboniphaga sp.]